MLTVLIQLIQLGGDLMISLDYKDGKTIHEQIETKLRELIINGILSPDEQLPSVREMSIELTVNPNTVQRAYKQLEQDGFIYSIKGKGNFVSPTDNAHGAKRIEELYQAITAAAKELMYLGKEKSGIENIINNVYAERRNEND